MSIGNLNHLRVAYVVSGYPSNERPNAGIFVHRSIKVLSQSVNPLVIHLRALKPARPIIQRRFWEGIEVINLSVPNLPSYKFGRINAWMMAVFGFRLVKRYLRDVDLIHSTKIFPVGFAVNRWARTLNKAHVGQAIGRDVNLSLTGASPDSVKWLYELDGIICNTSALSKRLKQLAPNLQNMRVIHRGVDTSIFRPDGVAIGPQENLPKIRFIYLGGFQTWNPKEYETSNYKGGHILLEAWQRVETQLGESSLLIGGAGAEQSNLQSWLSGLTKPDKIKIVSLIEPNSVPMYLRACDVAVLPSVTDGLPNLANEAQACARPVLGSDAGGIPETVVDGETGVIVSRNDPKALAEGIHWFFENPDQIPIMGQKARQHMISQFDWEIYYQKTLEMYEASLMHHRRS